MIEYDLVVTVFKIRSETSRTEAQFCQNLYIFIYDKEGKLAGPTQILPVNVRGPALILKTVVIDAGDGLLTIWYRAITWRNTDYMALNWNPYSATQWKEISRNTKWNLAI